MRLVAKNLRSLRVPSYYETNKFACKQQIEQDIEVEASIIRPVWAYKAVYEIMTI